MEDGTKDPLAFQAKSTDPAVLSTREKLLTLYEHKFIFSKVFSLKIPHPDL